MKLEPSFPDHWKTKRLQRACGAEAVLGLLRLWGQAKIKRQYSGLDLTASKLAAIMDYAGDQDALWAAMTDKDAPWLDAEDGGTWAIHGFAEHQRQIIGMWENGRKGGRPPKDKHPLPLPLPPLGSETKPNGNLPKPNGFGAVETPTLEAFKVAASMIGVEEEVAEMIWHDNESRPLAPTGEWTDIYGNPIRNWQSNMKARAAQIARKSPAKALTKPKGVWEAKQGLEALKSKLEKMKSDPRNRRHKTETPWETEWTPEAKAEVARIRAKISELEGVVAA